MECKLIKQIKKIMLCVLRGCVCLCPERDWTPLTIPILTEGWSKTGRWVVSELRGTGNALLKQTIIKIRQLLIRNTVWNIIDTTRISMWLFMRRFSACHRRDWFLLEPWCESTACTLTPLISIWSHLMCWSLWFDWNVYWHHGRLAPTFPQQTNS